MSRIVVIEGNICAGKTTFIKKLNEKCNVTIFLEPQADRNPYLKLYYEDKERWIFKLQHWFLANRLENYANVIQNSSKEKIIIMDRCVYSDVVFVNNALNTGIMPKEDYDVFMKAREIALRGMPLPDLIIHLDVCPGICHDRIHGDRKEECESSITIDYLFGLEKSYKEYLTEMEKKKVKIVKYNWNDFGDEEKENEIIELIKNN